MRQKIEHFLSETLWRMELSNRSKWFRILIHPLRFAVLTARACFRDGSMLHASALTYITMLAIVPVLALTLTSLKAFGAGEIAEEKLLGQIDYFVEQMDDSDERQVVTTVASADQQDVTEGADPIPEEEASDAHRAASALRKLCEDVFEQINSINFAQVGIVGAIILIIMVINVFGHIEHSFNQIWGVSKDRSLWRKFSDYLSMIIILPMLILATTSVPILEIVADKVPRFLGVHLLIEHLGIFNWLLPLLMGTVLLAFIFGFLPNTHVRLTSALFGGLITTLALGLFFKLCMALQVGIANNSSLYGSFVAFPLLLFWIYASWQMLLVGAEMCYVFQYRRELLRESAFSHPSERDTIVMALALVCNAARCIGDNEGQSTGKLSVADFADALSLPTREVQRVADILENSNILLSVSDRGTSVPDAYVFNRDIHRLRVSDVINACLDNTAGEEVVERTHVIDTLTSIQELNRRFSHLLTREFSMTIAQVIKGPPRALPAATPTTDA